MPLTFDVTGMKNYDALTSLTSLTDEGKYRWHYVTESLVYATMAVGINTITEKNWVDFYQRLHAIEKVTSPSLWRGNSLGKYDKNNYITPLEVYMHIGLSTNASSMSLTKFREHLYYLSCNETHHSKFENMEAEYDLLGIASISKEDWIALWENPERTEYTANGLMKQYVEGKQEKVS